MSEPKTPMHKDRRRGIIRTALVLAAIVMAIYLFFIGRAVLTSMS
ncbi:MAG: hypothetical protein V2J20_02385 [Wenzhouxiangella sp.]|jgi:hypothetical protein|nr:hypothetical protein [Wenzhouxiangella sp.]